MAYPFFLGIWLSLTNKLVGFSDYDYVGLANYRWFWTDPIFRQTVINTFIYGFVTVPFKLLLGLGLALLLNERFHFSRFLRAGLLLPWIVPTAISSLAWLMLFDRRPQPDLLDPQGLGRGQPQHQLPGRSPGMRAPRSAWPTSGAVSPSSPSRSWPACRPCRTICMRPPRSMAPTPGSASTSVTLPVIRNIVLITTLFSIIWTFSDFQLIYVLTKGGPANATHVFGTYSYQTMPSATSAGAATISLSMFPILALFAVSCCATSEGGLTAMVGSNTFGPAPALWIPWRFTPSSCSFPSPGC